MNDAKIKRVLRGNAPTNRAMFAGDGLEMENCNQAKGNGLTMAELKAQLQRIVNRWGLG